MDFSGDHRCEVYCIGENSLAHPSADMCFLSAATRQPWPAVSASLGFLGPFTSSRQASSSLSFSLLSGVCVPGNLPHWIIASVDQFPFQVVTTLVKAAALPLTVCPGQMA